MTKRERQLAEYVADAVADDTPVAWAVTIGPANKVSVYEAFAAHQKEEAIELADKCRFGDTGMELPLAPLYFAPTLTDEEREAIREGADALYGDSYDAEAATLRKLLERLNMTRRDRQADEYAAESYGKTPTERGVLHMSGAHADIVDRLREASHFALMDAARGLVREAADEIERLESIAALDGKTIGILVGECQDLLGRVIDGQEWPEESAALLWKIKVQSNIIARLKATLEKR